MRESFREYAPYVAFFGLMLAAAGLMLSIGGQLPRPVAFALLGVGIACMLVWPLVSAGDFRTAMGSRQTRFGGNAILLTVLVLVAIGAINFIADKAYLSWDMTSNQRFTLSRQTIQILNELDEPVHITAILPSTEIETIQSVNTLIERYKRQDAKNRLTYTYIDPLRDRLQITGLATRLQKNASDLLRSVVAEIGDRNAVVYSSFDEQAITEAIVKAMRDRSKTVAFTTGHGERTPDGVGDRGFAALKTALEQEGYIVTSLNLAVSPTIGADVVVVGGATRPLSTTEVTRLANYVQNGGKALLMLETDAESGLEGVMSPFGITVNDDLGLDYVLNDLGQPVLQAVLGIQGEDYQQHTITKDLKQLTTLLPYARSLNIGTPITEVYQVSPLIKSSARSWGETNYDALKVPDAPAPTKDETDTAGPLTIAAAAETRPSGDSSDANKGQPIGRLVVLGSSSFVADDFGSQVGGQYANYNLALNALNWLAQDEILISIRPLATDDRPLQPPSNGPLLALMVLLVAPLAVLGVGSAVPSCRHRVGVITPRRGRSSAATPCGWSAPPSACCDCGRVGSCISYRHGMWNAQEGIGLHSPPTPLFSPRAVQKMGRRSRNASHPAPPPQIRTCGATAYGSCLGS